MLHEIKPLHPGKTKKRVGRGGKRGDNSGTGHKGQKSRAGHKMNPALHEMLIRIPKLRGFKNKPLFGKAMGINLNVIDAKMTDTLVTLETLVAAGVIRKSDTDIKILGNGDVTKKFTVKGLEVSKSAKEKIEVKGGSVEAPTVKPPVVKKPVVAKKQK
ncbi:MAG: 50S ribosomal protein L15 [Candidatus Wolfebacteria bacterium GW2011_GWC2_46_275]|uniref:Large ribosomal subunit protein uL15 n=2 Tax=Candidatus Wolfeibacteriota TaxID=1752735 RepID=A0A0G1U8W4_9BACT|nr:MAG: 50S ribosomal protein L15, large subunit ribosomal protein L15 [Candidatus Wolfebacteria bacterium GW2011_GWB1_47_1]KKU36272.1 MAG: 50S ribosomal protein L15 [Candidatus Wolfebacteria bacterium GW2011_GWC2_46_275]KKU42129.1 MAG: 50S ribosomal protein L15 [Candidatus Wolfebacteria bacterium GW2011_GWB2_46_69]KKU54095.1 MAG: 50S ribosomal protein L15 [Candidatus Wolfebacteria bacterium GW2011_GWC1_47_103]KKU59282.1 MAG: 50S ribosomal protein L15 [Candidatus Wolfebacteria bacterium GW2011_